MLKQEYGQSRVSRHENLVAEVACKRRLKLFEFQSNNVCNLEIDHRYRPSMSGWAAMFKQVCGQPRVSRHGNLARVAYKRILNLFEFQTNHVCKFEIEQQYQKSAPGWTSMHEQVHDQPRASRHGSLAEAACKHRLSYSNVIKFTLFHQKVA